MDILSSPDFKIGDRLLYEGEVSPNMRQMIGETKQGLSKAFRKMRQDIRDLVRVRNNIFKNLKELAPWIDIVRNTQAQTKDILNFLRHYEKTENNPHFSIYSLCDIEMRKKECDPESEVYITDEDQMTVINSLNGSLA